MVGPRPRREVPDLGRVVILERPSIGDLPQPLRRVDDPFCPLLVIGAVQPGTVERKGQQLRRLEGPGDGIDRGGMGQFLLPAATTPLSTKRRAVTRTRPSSDPTALLYAATALFNPLPTPEKWSPNTERRW